MGLGEKIKNFGSLLKRTFTEWNAREPFNNSIIIAYYTIFSLPGLLVIIVNLAGYFFGQDAVTNKISSQIGGIVGGDTAKGIEEMIGNAYKSEGTTLSTILSVATLIFGATGVVYQLQQILNKMWEVEPKPKQMILKLIKDRVFSFGLILGIGFLLLVSLVLSAAVTSLSDWFSSHVSKEMEVLFSGADILISLGIITMLFAAMFKFLPDAEIRWRDVWVGALVTSILFVVAKFALGLYFSNSDPASTYGAAGSVILILLWVNYSGLILLFGAEFTQVYANTYGVKIRPSSHAVSTAGRGDNGAIVNKKTNAEARAGSSNKRSPEPTTPRSRSTEVKTVRNASAEEVERRKKENLEKTLEQTADDALKTFEKAAGAVIAPIRYVQRENEKKKKKKRNRGEDLA